MSLEIKTEQDFRDAEYFEIEEEKKWVSVESLKEKYLKKILELNAYKESMYTDSSKRLYELRIMTFQEWIEELEGD